MQRREGRRHMTQLSPSTISVSVPAGAGQSYYAPRIAAVLRGEPTRANPPPPPDGLLTSAEAARKLRCSIKTLNAHVAAGDLRYVIIGKGTKRPRRMYVAADLDAFIANQTRKDVPCPPTGPTTAARRISTTTSKCEVIGFTARRNARRAVKPKK